MAAEKDDFNITGPKHLKDLVDWDDDHYKRSVVAALVQGVYILERDRQEKRKGPQARAPPWWEFFSFKLVRELVDEEDNTIIGAVFEYDNSTQGHPHYIVSFRGTLLKSDSVIGDVLHDVKILVNKLYKTARVETALKAVNDVVASEPNKNVWLAGHSLGASMAMLAAKNMALSSGTHLQTFLFNPPFLSTVPIEKIRIKAIKHGLRMTMSSVTAGFARVKKKQLKSSSEEFYALTKWVPNLFVHPSDPICSEYIGFFGIRRKMEQLGMGRIVQQSLPHSLAGLMMNTFGKKAVSAAHLIPSARLTVNNSNNMASSSRLRDWFEAHELEQWWSPKIQLNTDVHRYEPTPIV